MRAPELTDPVLSAKLQCVLESYRRYTGVRPCALSELFEAPFALLAHGVEEPPVLFYGNRRALTLWKYSFEQFTRLPSLRTAEADLREARERLLAEVRAHGITHDYTGVRVASDGTRFEIQRASVWNVHDAEGLRMGQAAMFHDVKLL